MFVFNKQEVKLGLEDVLLIKVQYNIGTTTLMSLRCHYKVNIVSRYGHNTKSL